MNLLLASYGSSVFTWVVVCAGLLFVIRFIWARRSGVGQDGPFEADSAPSLRQPDPIHAESIANAPQRFNEWLDAHRDLADPWPDFGEFVRATLLACCGASQIKAYRLLSADDTTFFPLHETAPKEKDFPPVRSGILGHVASSGLSHYADDFDGSTAGTSTGDESCAWCFAVHFRGGAIGVIQVGELPASSSSARLHLQLVEGVVALCWSTLTEACRSRLADHTDPVAGVLTPAAFVDIAGRSVREAYTKNEPVAVVSFNVEGLRRLTDRGEWEAAKDAVGRVSEILRARIRDDDCAGFFDGSRFIVLLRRVDEELARLIVKKIHTCATSTFSELGRAGEGVGLRCGLATSGSAHLPLRVLIARAGASCTSAREQGTHLSVDSGEAERVGAS
ncbi:MAG: diguanylate cyclase [Planctomycetes bacterium]|nr:diguanylate cyclase [Planctomycetota bacterium]